MERTMDSEIWNETLNQLSTQLTYQEYNTWINQLNLKSVKNGSITLSVPSKLVKDIIEERYLKKINEIIRNISDEELSVKLIVDKSSNNGEVIKTTDSSTTKLKKKFDPRHNMFDPKYTFEKFVVGDSNALAAAAAKKVAENPGKYWNPLFLYGGVGLGKTHLLHAIGHTVIDKFPEMKILYITGESFMNDYITSIQKGTMNSFRIKYRKADLLLIDDIHNIQGKEGTMEELFHTFNTLYAAKKQMVFTSDRPPKELKRLEDRLRSRFEWGLTADIQPPNFEMRELILRQKIEEENYNVPDEVIRFIAENFTWNIRDLEGALKQLYAYHDIMNEEITLELAKKALKDKISVRSVENITIDMIQRKVANAFNVSFSDMKSKKRAKNIAFPRQVAMFLARKLTEYSTTEIGNEFGGKDHSTVIHAISKIGKRYETDELFRNRIDRIIKSIKEDT